MREAHQKVMAAAAVLEGEIERLNHPLPWSQLEVRVRSKGRDCQRCGATEHKRRHCQVQFDGNPTPHHPSRKSPEYCKGEMTPKDLDLGEPLELEPGVTSFLRGSVESLEEGGPPPEPPVWELHEWVTWKAETTKIPD